MELIYLDNAATTKTRREVVTAMLPYFSEHFGNPESVHAAALRPRAGIANAEKHVRGLLHAGGHGVLVFTSGGTESNNMAFKLCQAPKQMALTVITSATEHKSVLEPARACSNAVLRMLFPGRKGYISGDALSPDEVPAYTLVSTMHMNNETGTVNDVYGLGEFLHRFSDLDVFYHVDCVQSAGELPIDVCAMHADLVSVSSHKLHGPKGVGCLWVSDRLMNRLADDGRNLAVILGGGQQLGFRAGTMDVPGIVGFGKACELMSDVSRNSAAVSAVAGIFLATLEKRCKDLGIEADLNFAGKPWHDPKILSLIFPKADAETVVMIASRNGLCISNGAACNSVSSEPSYVLTNSGLTPDEARNTVRVSFSCDTTPDEAEKAAEILAETVAEVLVLNQTET